MWGKLLVSKYGNVGSGAECLNWRGDFSKGSYWWMDIGKVTSSSPYGHRNWFNGNISKKLGNGSATLFWHEAWIGDSLLCHTFPRLYNVSLSKDNTVAEMGNWTEQGWVWNWSWRRQMFEWESDLFNSLLAALCNVHLSPNEVDSWTWTL